MTSRVRHVGGGTAPPVGSSPRRVGPRPAAPTLAPDAVGWERYRTVTVQGQDVLLELPEPGAVRVTWHGVELRGPPNMVRLARLALQDASTYGQMGRVFPTLLESFFRFRADAPTTPIRLHKSPRFEPEPLENFLSIVGVRARRRDKRPLRNA